MRSMTFSPEEPEPSTASTTRERILKAAGRALSRQGYEQITTRRIAEEARVNVATLHYHFGTKEALLREAVSFALGRMLAQLQEAVAAAPNAAEALRQVIQLAWEAANGDPGPLRYDLVVRGFRDPAARAQVQAIYATYHALIEDLLRRHLSEGGILADRQTPAQLAAYLLATMDGLVLLNMITEDRQKAEGNVQLLLREIERYLM